MPTNTSDRLDSKEETFIHVPFADHPIDYNEWHAIELGSIGVGGDATYSNVRVYTQP